MAIPEIFVLSGPNGAGKSTTARVLLPETLSIEQFVNADLIAQGLSPFAHQSSALEAGRLMLSRIHDFRSRGQSFAFETTLASRSYVTFLKEAQLGGYLVHIAYIWMSSVELAHSRVANRVQEGGQDVPRATVERRFWRGLKNFFNLYQPLADTWALCNNSGEELSTIARGRKGVEAEVFEVKKYATIRRQTAHGP